MEEESADQSSPFSIHDRNTEPYQHTDENDSHLLWNVNDFSGIDANALQRECDTDSLEALSFPFIKGNTFGHYLY